MIANNHSLLPVIRVAEIVAKDDSPRWLIDQLWGAAAVGVIGGAPKCSKTWLALDMSLSVATGTACLDRYAVPAAGPVLIYLAEDSLAIERGNGTVVSLAPSISLHHAWHQLPTAA